MEPLDFEDELQVNCEDVGPLHLKIIKCRFDSEWFHVGVDFTDWLLVAPDGIGTFITVEVSGFLSSDRFNEFAVSSLRGEKATIESISFAINTLCCTGSTNFARLLLKSDICSELQDCEETND